MSRTIRTILIVSVVFNVIAAGAVLRTIQLRGGWEYLKARVAGEHAPSQTDPDLTNYTNRETLFEALPITTGSVVFVGDSGTQGCEWNEFFPGALNRGIGGDTSVGVLRRISTITRLRPSAVFLEIGANDQLSLGTSPEQTVANIQAIVSEIRRSSPETIIYIESIGPTRITRKNIFIRAVNDQLPRIADGKHVVYINMYNDFLEGTLLSPKITFDGVHLTGPGYLIWKRHVEPYVPRAAHTPRQGEAIPTR